MSIGLVFDLSDLFNLSTRLTRLADLDTEQLLDAIGAEVSTQTRSRIEDEKTSPDGEPWADHSPAYAAMREPRQKADGEAGLLELDGHLLESIQQVVEDGQVRVGSNLDYATTQQFGAKARSFGGIAPWGDIPARPYLGLSDDNKSDLQTVIDNFLDQAFEDAMRGV